MTIRTPSTLAELAKMIEEGYDPKTEDLKQAWLEYIYNSLTARKTYHKKQQVKRKLLIKYANEQLADDELQSIEKQAEDEADKLGGDV